VTPHQRKISAIVKNLLEWFPKNARDLPWRRTNDPYGVYVSEIMLQQTQVNTVIPFWNRWLHELPSIEAVAKAPSEKIHKLWEGLGYYTRVRNLQKAAQVIREKHAGKFPENIKEILALPGIGRYTAGAICSIAFNQPTPILDGNVIRVLTRIFGVAENPKEKATNARLWQLAEELVRHSSLVGRHPSFSCSHLNQSLMELGALVCTPRNPQCPVCPAKKFCVAFCNNRVEKLPNLGRREAATDRHFIAFVIAYNKSFLIRQRPDGVVNAHLWEFPNVETLDAKTDAQDVFKSEFGFVPLKFSPLCTLKHSITRYRITLEAYAILLDNKTNKVEGSWKTHAQMQLLAFTAAHKKLASAAAQRILSSR
jgi:A/G-specific adenine glycosylase